MKSAFETPNIDPKLLPYLLAGGAGALAGGTLTAMSPERQGESRMKRRWRILRNALLLGGAGAGGAALVNKGIQSAITEPLPKDDVNPTQKSIHDLTSGGNGALVAGGLAGSGLAGKVRKEERQTGNSFYTHLKNDGSGTSTLDNPRPALRNWILDNAVAEKPKDLTPEHRNMFRESGVNVPLTQRRGLRLPRSLAEVGGEEARIWGQRLTGIGREGVSKRLAILAAAAGIPALISHYTKSDQ